MTVTRRPTEAEWRIVEEETARRPQVSRQPEDAVERDDRQPEGARERVNRRWQEVLQETRVAQTGVQILFGFLLSLAFTARFRELGGFDRGLYVVTIILAASSTAALIAPVSLHRCLSGLRLKEEVVTAAGRLMVCGMVLLALTVACTLMLILNVVLGGALAAGIVVGAVMLWFALCWHVTPYRLRRKALSRNQYGGRR
ncbi:DUF6328 family protein [Streptomyces globisporus]|uniref:DUF6328 family protein n=1 Tax=Streptomyces globisporus TaxID=1908 RepID=UPI0004CBC3C5|nr:DUF6328 family protein [Streptomyces globisporus]